MVFNVHSLVLSLTFEKRYVENLQSSYLVNFSQSLNLSEVTMIALNFFLQFLKEQICVFWKTTFKIVVFFLPTACTWSFRRIKNCSCKCLFSISEISLVYANGWISCNNIPLFNKLEYQGKVTWLVAKLRSTLFHPKISKFAFGKKFFQIMFCFFKLSAGFFLWRLSFDSFPFL